MQTGAMHTNAHGRCFLFICSGENHLLDRWFFFQNSFTPPHCNAHPAGPGLALCPVQNPYIPDPYCHITKDPRASAMGWDLPASLQIQGKTNSDETLSTSSLRGKAIRPFSCRLCSPGSYRQRTCLQGSGYHLLDFFAFDLFNARL